MVDGKEKLLYTLFLSLLILNFAIINGIVLYHEFPTGFTVYPGEDYFVNVPFEEVPENETSSVCGKTYLIDKNFSEENLSNKNVTLIDSNKEEVYSITSDSNGDFCIELDASSEKKEYSLNVSYDNESYKIIKNDFELSGFETLKNNYSPGEIAILKGEINNDGPKITNGRIESIIRCENIFGKYECDYPVDKKIYYIQEIPSGVDYDFPRDNLNLTWEIPKNIEEGKYTFDLSVSFNGKERSTSISDMSFNITE